MGGFALQMQLRIIWGSTDGFQSSNCPQSTKHETMDTDVPTKLKSKGKGEQKKKTQSTLFAI